ncbi:MAG TPA: hypothetical protein DDW18_03570 [Firmicutes bacterium]|nr:hypothetical protein [Bacillota bacterium]
MAEEKKPEKPQEEPKPAPPSFSNKKEEKKKNNASTPLYPTSVQYAKRRKERNIALIVTGVGLVGVLMLGIISFLGKVSGQFTIKMDPRVAPSTMKLLDKPVDGTYKEILTAEGLTNAQVTTANRVFEYVDTLKEDNNLNGSHNMSKTITTNKEEKTLEFAFIYTFYAENISENEDAIFDYQMTIDDYASPTNAAYQPYTYLRVALFENPYVAEGNGKHDVSIYALESTELNASQDYRECLSTSRSIDSLRTPAYSYQNYGYCEPFEDPYTIFNRQGIILEPRKMMRFTVVAWLEGNDPECRGEAPEDCSFTFSMSFTSH